jgi:hypothetical protein
MTQEGGIDASTITNCTPMKVKEIAKRSRRVM